MLKVSHVSKAFGSTQALADVSISVRAGEVLALVGENGSGKSTLMKIIAGEEILDSGEMRIADALHHPRNPLEGRKSGVHLVRQELAVCPHLSIAENLYLGTQQQFGFSPSQCEQKARELLASLGYPEMNVAKRLGDCSIAEQQVTEIARCRILGSKVVLFDEPTSSLSKPDIEKLFALIEILKAEGCAIIYISHFLDEVQEVSDQVVILRDGELVFSGKTSELDRTSMIRHMVGREVNDLYPRSDREFGEVILEVENLSGKVNPVDAELSLRRGEIVGFAGMNGSGRTELLRAIFRLDKVKSGAVQVEHVSLRQPWSQGVGFVSEDRKTEGLSLSQSIFENLLMPSRKGWLFREKREISDASSYAAVTRVKCRDVEQRIGDLSGGNQQKVALARLLAANCDVLILDEPTRGIDVGSKAEIYAMLDDLAKQGKAILVASSYLPELLGICDRIHVMNQGRLLPSVPVAEATQESLMEMCI